MSLWIYLYLPLIQVGDAEREPTDYYLTELSSIQVQVSYVIIYFEGEDLKMTYYLYDQNHNSSLTFFFNAVNYI